MGCMLCSQGRKDFLANKLASFHNQTCGNRAFYLQFQANHRWLRLSNLIFPEIVTAVCQGSSWYLLAIYATSLPRNQFYNL